MDSETREEGFRSAQERKHAAMLKHLQELNEARIHQSQTRKSETQEAPSFESLDVFLNLLSHNKQNITEKLQKICENPPQEIQAAKSCLESLGVEIDGLEKLVAENSYFLPSYEIRSAHNTISELRDMHQKTSTQVLPKKRFSFRNKPLSKLIPSPPQKESQPDGVITEKTEHVNQGRSGAGLRNKVGVVVVKDLGEDGGEFELSDLDNCRVYLRGTLRALFLFRLKGCHVFVGPVTGSVLVQDVEKCVVMLASHQIRIHETRNTDMYLRVRSRPIVEYVSGVRFAPYALSYSGIDQHLRDSNLHEEEDSGMWEKVDDFRWLRAVASPNWCVLPPYDRMPPLDISHLIPGETPLGIDRTRVEQMEARLKEDILNEAERYGNKILVTDELPDGQMVDQWDPITEGSIQTPLEVYDELKGEGYLVDYERVPITDEKSPKERDFDLLVHRVLLADVNTEIIFNCQMGRGRTTTGMVIATLVYLNRIGRSGIPRSSSMGKILDSGSDMFDDIPDSEEALRRGEYTVIRSLIRVLEGGVEGKRQVDKVIDRCSAMQNLREAILTYRNSIQRQPDEKKRESALSFFVEYLERYYFLICFAVYLHMDRNVLCSRTSMRRSFASWMKERPELYSILRRLLRRDPMGALTYGTVKPSLRKISSSPDGRPLDMDAVAAKRTGEVLGRQTVLKSDHCPGCQNLALPERVEGAPNFRSVPGFPVHGVANPTVDGIRNVIEKIGGKKGGRPVLWHNMREEPVVYINGRPFVLREVERPYKNMLEYSGIDKDRVERMEARLKEDILREAERYHGAIMVIHEADDGRIYDAWESVNSSVVQTPLEVFKELETEGYPLHYARVPITDGKAPKSSDFDALAKEISSAPKETAYVFNCQMGRGRTTTGTVIACLVKLRVDNGRPLRFSPADYETGEVDSGFTSGEDGNSDVGSPVTKNRRKSLSSNFGIDDIPLLRKVTRLFDNGVECRLTLDSVIDCCSALQNIREAVLRYRRVFNQQHIEQRERRVALNRGAEYLERYFLLIAFSAYLGSPAFDGFCGSCSNGVPFKTWLHKRPEVQEMKWSLRLRPARFFTIPAEFKTSNENQDGDTVMEAIVKARNGSVLGKRSILKMYFFPGQRMNSEYAYIDGAPHVFKVEDFPVYSMATPTINGAKAVLSSLGVCPSSAADSSHKAVITDLREEAVVYIKGNPYVLRELYQPVDTLKHVGIKGYAVEHMEARLKEDIISEAERSGGRVLLHREEFNTTTNQSDLIGFWENITADDVMTPAEVYSTFKIVGYKIDYKRIPLTREREALATDVDAIQRQLDDQGAEYLFVSHTGFGGIAYAMAITCLSLEAEKVSRDRLLSGSTVFDSLSPRSPTMTRTINCEESFRLGDFRDILSLTRVLSFGPSSKSEVDAIIDKCAGAGHLRNDILDYKKKLENCFDEDSRSYLSDMGIKALRRYFFLISFRSYLYNQLSPNNVSSTGESEFSAWMQARPELGHLCDNLKLDK